MAILAISDMHSTLFLYTKWSKIVHSRQVEIEDLRDTKNQVFALSTFKTGLHGLRGHLRSRAKREVWVNERSGGSLEGLEGC